MDKCFKCKGTGIIPGSIPALDKPCDACRKPSPAPKAGEAVLTREHLRLALNTVQQPYRDALRDHIQAIEQRHAAAVGRLEVADAFLVARGHPPNDHLRQLIRGAIESLAPAQEKRDGK